jgi:hypothetical protein
VHRSNGTALARLSCGDPHTCSYAGAHMTSPTTSPAIWPMYSSPKAAGHWLNEGVDAMLLTTPPLVRTTTRTRPDRPTMRTSGHSRRDAVVNWRCGLHCAECRLLSDAERFLFYICKFRDVEHARAFALMAFAVSQQTCEFNQVSTQEYGCGETWTLSRGPCSAASSGRRRGEATASTSRRGSWSGLVQQVAFDSWS